MSFAIGRQEIMKKYERPVVMVNEELAEGVYAASGCWTSGAENHQTRATGRDNFCFQVFFLFCVYPNLAYQCYKGFSRCQLSH